jgi:hypothetical protein
MLLRLRWSTDIAAVRYGPWLLHNFAVKRVPDAIPTRPLERSLVRLDLTETICLRPGHWYGASVGEVDGRIETRLAPNPTDIVAARPAPRATPGVRR